jgi:alpha-galactosidase
MRRLCVSSCVCLGIVLALVLSAGVGWARGVAGQSGPPLLSATPPMGFNTWNKFGCNVSEQLIRETADAMVATGMRDAGYKYVVIDDCWQVARNADGTILPDAQRFPGGMKALGDYVHSKGLGFGIYTDAGLKTCEGRPGSYGYEEIDARTYAGWGVDYVKVDWCNADNFNASVQYTKISDAFKRSGRQMVLSICEWGRNDPWAWAPKVGQLWRTTADIGDRWDSLTWIINANAHHDAVAGPGHWNDPDMLEVGNGGMTTDEYKAHFSLWAIMAAPLIAGNDLRAMTQDTRDILLNKEVIAVDQDPLGIQGRIIIDRGYGGQVWMKPLADGSKAVALLNLSEKELDLYVRWAQIGIPAGPAAVRDLWAHKDLGPHTDTGARYDERFHVKVPAHGVAMVRIKAQ